MNKIMIYNKLIVATAVLSASAFVACSDHDEWDSPAEVPTVNAHLTFALPQRIVVGQKNGGQTRMSADVVQLAGSTADFRGLENIRLLCFNQVPALSSRSTSNVIQLPGTNGHPVELATNTDYSVVRQIAIPIGTTHFTLYAQSIDNATTHDDFMKYGALKVSGLDTYSNNTSVGFEYVPICASTAEQGGSTTGQALVALLNNIMHTTSNAAAPDDSWATTDDERLHEAYRGMTTLTTLSSAGVERMLGKVYKQICDINETYPGRQLADNIISAITDACATAPAPGSDKLTLKDEYQGFPADINLPEGAARIEWNATTEQYQTPDTHDYGRGLTIPAMGDYVYPANLQYMVSSSIVASDSLALTGDMSADAQDDNDNGTNNNQDNEGAGSENSSASYQNWQQLINEAYANGYTEVKSTTQSVAMVKQVQYAVGRLDTRVTMESSCLYDATGKSIDVSDGFTLKGYIIGGQRQSGFDFKPVDGAHDYAIYDTQLNGTRHKVKYAQWTDYNYTLGLPTSADANVLIALELVNDGPDFQGADGLIAHGATFYLVANMVPNSANNYSSGNLDRIFISDHITTANMQIMAGNRDVNGDDVPDTDNNNDNIPDKYVKNDNGLIMGIDLDGDDILDDFDVNHDGHPDHIVYADTDNDGVIDSIGWDTNNDNRLDVAINRNDDGSWPDTPTVAKGLATATYGIPNLVNQDVRRTFGVSVNLSWNIGFVFPDVPL